jgi:uncharacterized protein
MLRHAPKICLPLAVAACLLASTAANAAEPGCAGKNMLEAWKATNPQAVARVDAAATKSPNGKTVLWKIEHADFEDRPPSYLYGTLAVTDPRLQTLTAATEDAFSTSRRVALEVEDLNADRTTEAIGIMSNSMAPGAWAKTDKLLAKPEQTRANVILARSPLPKDWLPKVKPWVAILAAARSDCELSRVKSGKLTHDRSIAEIAENRGVGAFGLESAEASLGGYAELSDEDQLALLKARLGAYDRLDDHNATMVDLYMARNIGALLPLQQEIDKAGGVSATTLEALRQSTIEDRNIRMRDRMAMHLAYGGVFVAVAAIHLPGEKGLVELLKDAGFKLTAVE